MSTTRLLVQNLSKVLDSHCEVGGCHEMRGTQSLRTCGVLVI